MEPIRGVARGSGLWGGDWRCYGRGTKLAGKRGQIVKRGQFIIRQGAWCAVP